MRTIAINPAPRKAKKNTTKRGKTVAKKKTKKRTPAKKNPTRRRPRRNQAKMKVTPIEARNLAMAGAGGATAGAMESYIDDLKPAFLDMVPTGVVSVGIGVLLTAVTKAAPVKSFASGWVAQGAGSAIKHFMNQGPAKTETKTEDKSTAALLSFSNPTHYRTNMAGHVGNLISISD